MDDLHVEIEVVVEFKNIEYIDIDIDIDNHLSNKD
jgi:hypothetical protein